MPSMDSSIRTVSGRLHEFLRKTLPNSWYYRTQAGPFPQIKQPPDQTDILYQIDREYSEREGVWGRAGV